MVRPNRFVLERLGEGIKAAYSGDKTTKYPVKALAIPLVLGSFTLTQPAQAGETERDEYGCPVGDGASPRQNAE